VHAEPFRGEVEENTAVTIVLGVDYNNYYANMARTVLLGRNSVRERVLEYMEEAYGRALELTKPGAKPIEVMRELDAIYRMYGLIDRRVVGYLHGVGLQIEELPITTIIPKHRFTEIKHGMVIAFVHALIVLRGVGQVKHEDTFIVTSKGLERVTCSSY